MRKTFVSLFIFIVSLLFINTSYSFEVKQLSKTEIDKIKCDLHFDGKLEKDFNYSFSDTFSNTSSRYLKVEKATVNVYEEEDFNGSNNFSEFNFTTWANGKNNIFAPGDKGTIIKTDENYSILKGAKNSNGKNLQIKYTLKYFYKNSNGKYADGPYYHTECKDYKIVGEIKKEVKESSCDGLYIEKKEGLGSLKTEVACFGTNIKDYKLDCGNGKSFIETINKDGNGKILQTCNYSKPGKYTVSCSMDNKEVKNICKKEVVVRKEILDEKEIKRTYEKYKFLEDELEKINEEENERGIGLIKLPKILPKTGTPILERVKKLNNKLLNVDLINERFKLAGSTNESIEFWKKSLDEKDRNADKYIVIPSNGLVIPVNEVPKDAVDYKHLLSGREIKINQYLKTGAMEYPGTSINGFGKVGNKVVFAHSSYWKKDNGRYKTDFQKIIELDVGEEIWVYEKNNGAFSKFKYKTVKSYNTKPTNVSVLKPGIGKNLTLFTCTPIGGIAGRWVVEAKYIDNNKIELEKQLKFESIDTKIKIKIINIVNRIGNIDNGTRNKTIIKVFNSIIKKEKQISNLPKTEKTIFIKNILEYLKYKLALEYYK